MDEENEKGGCDCDGCDGCDGCCCCCEDERDRLNDGWKGIGWSEEAEEEGSREGRGF